MARPALGAAETAAIEQASDWFLRMREGRASEAELERWLSRAPLHRQAWQWVTAAEQRFGGALPPDMRDALLRAPPTRRRALKTLAVLAGAGGLAWGGRHWHTDAVAGGDVHTALGEIRDTALPDGSRLWLDTRSSVDVAFGETLRQLSLRAGRILIQTAGDPQRPFVVDVPAGRLTALGTRFSVTRTGPRVEVAVFEGAVALQPRGDDRPAAILHPGEQAAFLPRQPVARMQAVEERRDAAWTRGVLVAQRMALQDFLDALARYRPGVIRCAPELRSLELVGIYPLRDTDAALDVLAATLPVKVERSMRWWVSVRPR